MLRRRKRDPEDPAAAARELRLRALHVEPAAIGIEPSDRFPTVFGVVMETGHPTGVSTLVSFADGTTSLYTSTGFGIIGGGEHAQVVRASRTLLRLAEEQRDALAPDTSDEPPRSGFVTIRLLTYGGRLAATEHEAALLDERLPLAGLFAAGHAVIARLRELHEAAGG